MQLSVPFVPIVINARRKSTPTTILASLVPPGMVVTLLK